MQEAEKKRLHEMFEMHVEAFRKTYQVLSLDALSVIVMDSNCNRIDIHLFISMPQWKFSVV